MSISAGLEDVEGSDKALKRSGLPTFDALKFAKA
jgi:hypothetical protein